MNAARVLRLGTRGSDLALWQSRWVAARLRDEINELKRELREVTEAAR